MKIKTNIKGGDRLIDNHNEKMVSHRTKGLLVKSHIKAGFNPQPDPPGRSNHNETLVSDARIK